MPFIRYTRRVCSTKLLRKCSQTQTGGMNAIRCSSKCKFTNTKTCETTWINNAKASSCFDADFSIKNRLVLLIQHFLFILKMIGLTVNNVCNRQSARTSSVNCAETNSERSVQILIRKLIQSIRMFSFNCHFLCVHRSGWLAFGWIDFVTMAFYWISCLTKVDFILVLSIQWIASIRVTIHRKLLHLYISTASTIARAIFNRIYIQRAIMCEIFSPMNCESYSNVWHNYRRWSPNFRYNEVRLLTYNSARKWHVVEMLTKVTQMYPIPSLSLHNAKNMLMTETKHIWITPQSIH